MYSYDVLQCTAILNYLTIRQFPHWADFHSSADSLLAFTRQQAVAVKSKDLDILITTKHRNPISRSGKY